VFNTRANQIHVKVTGSNHRCHARRVHGTAAQPRQKESPSCSNMSSAAVAIEQRVLEGALVPSSASRNSLSVRLPVARLLVCVGPVSTSRGELARWFVWSPWSSTVRRFEVCGRLRVIVVAGSCGRSALRLVARRLSSNRMCVTRSNAAEDLHPSTIMSRWPSVDSHFFDLARPVALVASRCSYRKRLPRPSAGTVWSALSSSRAGRRPFTRYSFWT
jgi:hypothetical protein